VPEPATIGWPWVGAFIEWPFESRTTAPQIDVVELVAIDERPVATSRISGIVPPTVATIDAHLDVVGGLVEVFTNGPLLGRFLESITEQPTLFAAAE